MATAAGSRAEYDPETDSDVEPGWSELPAATFVEEGLLYDVNRNWFWPLGLALTAAAWQRFDELATEMRPRVTRALNATVANLPGAAAVTPAIVDAFLAIMLEDLAGKVRHGFRITQPEPPETIVTARNADEQMKVEMRATEWINARRAALVPEA